MSETQLLQGLIVGFGLIVGTASTAGAVAAYTFRLLTRNIGELADRLKKTADEREDESKAKIAEMEARASVTLELANVRNELTVVSRNAQQMDEAIRQTGIRLTAVENEKHVVEIERNQLKAENDQLKAENAELKAERDELTKQLANLQIQIDQLKIEVHNLQTQKALEDVPPKPSESPENINPALVLTAPESAIKPEGNSPL